MVFERVYKLIRELNEHFEKTMRELDKMLEETLEELEKEFEKLRESKLVKEIKAEGKPEYRVWGYYREFYFVWPPPGEEQARTQPIPEGAIVTVPLKYEIHDRGEYLEIIADVPGCDKDSIKVKYDELRNILFVEAVRKDTKTRYYAEIRLPVRAAEIKAEYRNGVLTIRIRKAAASPAVREVQVE